MRTAVGTIQKLMQPRLACRVQAGNAEGNGDFSSEAACSTAKPPPPAPTSVLAYEAAEHAGGCFALMCHDDACGFPGMVIVRVYIGAFQPYACMYMFDPADGTCTR